MKKLTEFDFGKIIGYNEQGHSIWKIAELMCIPKSTVGYCIKRYKDRCNNERKSGSGRRYLLKTDDIVTINRIVDKNPKISIPTLHQALKEKKKTHVSDQTVRRELKKGFYGL